MKKHSLALVLVAAGLVAVSLWVKPSLPQIDPTPGPTGSATIKSPVVTPTTGPLSAPTGWQVEALTKKVPGARDLVLDSFGNLWVSSTKAGTVSLVYLKDRKPGAEPQVATILKDLKNPHGLAFDPDRPTALYIAEEKQVISLPTYSDGSVEKVADLPAGGRHFTRSLLFGPDMRLYISIGSTCDVCQEDNPEHGSIIALKPSEPEVRTLVAKGLRNAVFLALDPSGQDIWLTEMGRDNLGDNLPPDEINVLNNPQTLTSPLNFGWPICYGQNIHDTVFDKNVYVRNPCQEPFELPSTIDIPAHSAPLGLAFVPQTSAWPKDWQGNLLVAYHGSWNRTKLTGYKVVRFFQTSSGWQAQDLLTGWLAGDTVIGRPVDILPTADGQIFISDDQAGVIWRVFKSVVN